MSSKDLDEEVRYVLLKTVAAHPQWNQRELSKEMNVSLGKINYCLKALIQRGYIKMGNFSRSKKKIGYAYYLTPVGMLERSRVTVQFLARKEREYKILEDEIRKLKQEIGQHNMVDIDKRMIEDLEGSRNQ